MNSQNLIRRFLAFAVVSLFTLSAAAAEVVGPVDVPAKLARWSGTPLAQITSAAEGGDASAQFFLAWHRFRGMHHDAHRCRGYPPEGDECSFFQGFGCVCCLILQMNKTR